MTISLKQVETYHKKKKIIPRIILNKTGRREIIYGQQAMNAYFPPFLDRTTEDFDIFSPTPKKDAEESEKALDRHMGFNAFKSESALHEGTYKVKSRITGSGIVDYTKPEEKIPYKIINGRKYIALPYVKKHIKKTLKDPEAKFRWEKDKDTLRRIEVYERLKKNKPTFHKIKRYRKIKNIYNRQSIKFPQLNITGVILPNIKY